MSLEGGGETEAPEHRHLRKNFDLLRRLDNVAIAGVSRVHAEYPRHRMTGCAPLDNLPKAYEVLELYAGPFNFSVALLQKAIDAVEAGHVQEFKDSRAQNVEQVDGYMKESASRLYEHDSQGEPGYGSDNLPLPELISPETAGDLTDGRTRRTRGLNNKVYRDGTS